MSDSEAHPAQVPTADSGDISEIGADEQGMRSANRDSLPGAHSDYTKVPIGRALILLAFPMVLEMCMESIFAVVDIFWVAHLGADAVATVGITESMLTLMYAVAIGLGIGATAMVARRIGEKNPEGAARAAVQAIALGLIVSVAVAIIGVSFADRLLALMGGSPWVLEHGSGFTKIMFAGNATILLLFLINAIFRGAGDAAIAMRVLFLANTINILLGPCFIFGLGPFPELGVTGAAVATNIGRGTGVLYAFTRLIRPGGRIDITRTLVKLEPAIIARLIRLSATATFQVFIGMASWIGLVFTIARFGSTALAGYTIGIRVLVLALLPSSAMAK